jgi:magnesium transporter
MQELTVCTGKGVFLKNGDTKGIKQFLEETNDTLWLDIVDPDDDDIRLLREDFHFHPLAIEDATHRHQRPKVDSYEHYYFVVFYCMGIDGDDGRISASPLYLFIGQHYLVTVHRGPIDQVQETLRRWRDPGSPLKDDVGALIYALLDAIVDDYFPVMDQVAERVEDLEEQIFSNFDEAALQSIFRLKKDLLNVRRVVTPERDVLNVMLRRGIPVFSQDDVTYLQDVYDHIVRITDTLDTYRDLLSSSLDSFLSVQSNRLNQVVKVLTVTSIVLMSVTLVAGIYGMNFDNMPELHWRYGYVWALGLMAAISVGLVALFRRIKWL